MSGSNSSYTDSLTPAALDVLTLFGVSFGGPIFFWLPASTELFAGLSGRRGFSPSLVGATCAAGQCTLFALLFIFGQRITSRWSWLRRRVDAVARKQRKFLDRGKLAMTVGAAVGGVPPTVPLFTLAPTFQMRLTPMLLIVFSFRFIRFAACCFLGSLQWGASEDSRHWWVVLYEALPHSADWRAHTHPADTRFAMVAPLMPNGTVSVQ